MVTDNFVKELVNLYIKFNINKELDELDENDYYSEVYIRCLQTINSDDLNIITMALLGNTDLHLKSEICKSLHDDDSLNDLIMNIVDTYVNSNVLPTLKEREGK